MDLSGSGQGPVADCCDTVFGLQVPYEARNFWTAERLLVLQGQSSVTVGTNGVL
jgi:hypothetical protein